MAPATGASTPSPPPPGEVPSCAEGGVLGVLPGLLGTIQATEALKLVTGVGQPLVGRLLLVDALSMQFRTVKVRKDPDCPACGTRTLGELREETFACEAIDPDDRVPEITPLELAERIGRGDALTLLDVREPAEWGLGRIPGARLVPLARLGEEIPGLDPAREVVAYCRSGVRSQTAGRRFVPPASRASSPWPAASSATAPSSIPRFLAIEPASVDADVCPPYRKWSEDPLDLALEVIFGLLVGDRTRKADGMSANGTSGVEAPLVTRQDEGGVVTLTLNRGDRFNPLSTTMIAALEAQLDAVAADRTARVVVLAGAGRGFCAGHDLKEMRARSDDKAWQQKLFADCSRMMMKITEIPQPVIARVHGIATAAGCQLVSSCDLAVASTEARFALPGVNVGIFCSTPAVGVARNVGRKRAMEMLLTGELFDAPTALSWGLVNRVVPAAGLDAEVARFTGIIVARSGKVVASGKRTFYRQIEQPLVGAYALTTETMACGMVEPDAAEGIDAFLGKRPARWAAP